MDKSTISVMIPALIRTDKQLAMTLQCIEMARTETNLPFELVIVETESSYLCEYADIYVYERKRYNPARSHNHGWKVCNGDMTVLLTNDVYVESGWLESLMRCFDEKEDCGVATLASTQFGHIKTNKIEEGNWWSVAAIPQSIFELVGYYDERFFGSWEDTDLLVRIYKAGYKMYRNFNCVVEHLIGQTLYADKDHDKNYMLGRHLFNAKHDGCELPIFKTVR
jgi:GT2 family glycosyltransferase